MPFLCYRLQRLSVSAPLSSYAHKCGASLFRCSSPLVLSVAARRLSNLILGVSPRDISKPFQCPSKHVFAAPLLFWALQILCLSSPLRAITVLLKSVQCVAFADRCVSKRLYAFARHFLYMLFLCISAPGFARRFRSIQLRCNFSLCFSIASQIGSMICFSIANYLLPAIAFPSSSRIS